MKLFLLKFMETHSYIWWVIIVTKSRIHNFIYVIVIEWKAWWLPLILLSARRRMHIDSHVILQRVRKTLIWFTLFNFFVSIWAIENRNVLCYGMENRVLPTPKMKTILSVCLSFLNPCLSLSRGRCIRSSWMKFYLYLVATTNFQNQIWKCTIHPILCTTRQMYYIII